MFGTPGCILWSDDMEYDSEIALTLTSADPRKKNRRKELRRGEFERRKKLRGGGRAETKKAIRKVS